MPADMPVDAPIDVLYLYQIFAEAAARYFRAAPRREIRLTPNAWLVSSGELYADLNNVFIGPGDEAEARLRTFHQALQQRELAALYFFASEVALDLAATAAELGMSAAGEVPIMVSPPTTALVAPQEPCRIQQVENAAHLNTVCEIVAAAFEFTAEPFRRILTPPVLDVPGFAIYLAYAGAEPVCTVTLTETGPYVGVWAMATLPTYQRQGIGRNLLTQLMARYRVQGAQHFYLWPTEAGNRLYQQLGFRTVTTFSIWTTGQSVQV